MMSLNPFVDDNKTRMNLFLNALCDVGDFYDTLEVRFKRDISHDQVLILWESQMDQYMALSKKDLQINITMNEIYNTQSLLQQHIDSLVRNVISELVSLLNQH